MSSGVSERQKAKSVSVESLDPPPLPPPPWWIRLPAYLLLFALRALLLVARQATKLGRGFARLARRLAPRVGRWLRAAPRRALAARPDLALLRACDSVGRRVAAPIGVLCAVAAAGVVLLQLDAPAAPLKRVDGGSRATAPARRVADLFARERPALADERLRGLLKRLEAPAPARRRAAAKALLAATAADAPLLHRALIGYKRRASVSAIKRALRAIGAHVPNRHGRFGPPPKKQPDWLEALLDADGANKARGWGDALAIVTLARALAGTGHTEVTTTLLRLGFRYNGAFRDECGRLIRGLGERALPGLIRARLMRDPMTYRIKRYAAYQLDRMNRSRPELALKKADHQLRAEILHAYGETRESAAVAAVVAHTASRVASVRIAARWAALRYVSGVNPRARRRRLKLPGGRKTERARSLYLTYRGLARHQLARALARLKLKDGDGGGDLAALTKQLKRELDPRALAEKLFARQDAARQAAEQRRAERALELARSGAVDKAVAAVDRLLAVDPDQQPRDTVAELFGRKGRRLLQARRYDEAATCFTKALFLTPRKSLALRRRLAALRLLAEAFRDGVESNEPRLRLAAALAPGLDLVRQQLARMRDQRRRTMLTVTGVAGGVGVAVLALLLLLRRRRVM